MNFRDEAVRSAARPFETVEKPIPVRVPYFAVAAALVVALVAFGGWCILGRISEKAQGLGLIAGDRPVDLITSPGTGLVMTFDVRHGDIVQRGQIIGRIYSHEDQQAMLRAERRVEMLRANHARAVEEFRALLAKEDESDLRKLKQIDETARRYDEQIEWYHRQVTNVVALAGKGAVSKMELEELRDALYRRMDARAVLDYQRLEVISSRAPNDQDLRNDLRDHEEALNAALIDCDRIYRETLYRSLIVATTRGEVLGTLVSAGDRVKVGDQLVRIQKREDPSCHTVMAYFSAREARKLSVGMPAVVTPSTVRAEREGSLRGIVTEVDCDIDTREQMLCQLRNDRLVDRLIESSEDMPVRVQVQLICDPNRPDEFEWTGAGGRGVPIQPNTVCSVSVAYRRYAPYELALAGVNRAFTGAGVREEQIVRDPSADGGTASP